MAYNDYIIEKLRQCFEPDEYDQYTNCALVFAYNGTGKTRLSYDFAHYDRKEGDPQHTLYYNAYTEDLFTWNNDLENNTEYRLLINKDSSLITGLPGQDISDELRKHLHKFTDINFKLYFAENKAKNAENAENSENVEIPDYVTFSKTVKSQEEQDGEWVTVEKEVENIKISRGEERLFVWCFFRCILDLVTGGNDAYKDIEYIYIDDPMSSLDDNNVILFAEQLYSVIKDELKREKNEMSNNGEVSRRIKFVVSSHHALFFHVMVHGLSADRKLGRYYLSRDRQNDQLVLKEMSSNTPFYYNVAMMSELQRAINEDKLYTYHFNVLRSVMEKIKEFFGHTSFGSILHGISFKGSKFDERAFKKGEFTDLYSRIVNVFSHQSSMFAPLPMNDDNKELLKTIFDHLMRKYRFQLPDLTDERTEKEIDAERWQNGKGNR